MDFLYQALSAAALILSVFGNILINKQKRIGYVVWIISNASWIIVNIVGVETNWFQTIMFAVFIALNIHGIMSWRKMGKQEVSLDPANSETEK